MRLDRRRLILALLLVFIAVVTVIIAQKQETESQNVVQDFKVEDVPFDDGTGLILSWKPLHKDKRVIEYRIYRGVSPDTLFYHASVQVNVKTGVPSDRMFYYDTSYNPLIDIESPGKLKKEKQQGTDSPLYRKVPRDQKIASVLAEKLDMISIVDKADLYKRATKLNSADPADSSTYAGVKMHQQMIYAALRDGETYYYTVVAVNERNKFYTPAPVGSGMPVPNAPEPATSLYSSLVEDGNSLNFEWNFPLFKDDLQAYQIVMIPDGMSSEAWAALKDSLPADALPMITQGAVGGGALPNYIQIPLTDLAQQGLSPERLKTARFAIRFIDSQNMTSMSAPASVRVITTAQLPPKPTFRVEDKPNDKGDRLTVLWDDPIVFVTKTSITNSHANRLRVNYQLNKAETQKIKNIYFEFFKAGESQSFARINEFYPDNSVMLRVPAGYDYKSGFKVKITLNWKPRINEEYVIEQNLAWDDQMMSLMPSRQLYRNGVEVSKLQNVVYRKSLRGSQFTVIKSNTAYDNNLDVVIPYPTTITRGISGFRFVEGDSLVTIIEGKRTARALQRGDNRGSFTLVSSSIDLVYDKEAETTLSTSLFTSEAAKDLQETITGLEEQIAELNAAKASLDSLPPALAAAQLPRITSQLESLQKNLTAYQNNPILKKANQYKGQISRMRYIGSVREPDGRYQTYRITRTDGRGAITESDLDQNKDEEFNYYIPISNWFDQNKWVTLFTSLLFAAMVFVFVHLAKRGKSLYIRPIAGLSEIDNAIGRATEMGRPMLFSMGNGGLSDVATLASLGILGLVAKKAAEYDTKLIVPCYNYIIMPIAQEIVREAHYAVGRPDTYDKNNIFFLTDMQFAYVAGFNGIMVRERAATNFFMGYFAAESLLMTETGNSIGAIQVAGTDAVTQIPFFITSCDYTLIGEELYAASAYLNREPMLLGTLKAQDYFKFLILSVIIAGGILSTFKITALNNILPTK